MKPRATYRVQLTPNFNFDRVAAVVPYLAALGISHLYASPWLTARPGSTHHYDITDYSRIDEELGGETGFARLHAALQAHGMGHICDFVPNHMGVGFADNRLWLDVLEWGRESKYADWFDIDWDNLDGKILVPLLGRQYGVELESGTFELKFENGAFAIWAYGVHKLPVCPRTYPLILGADFEVLSDRFGHLRSPAEAAAVQEDLSQSHDLVLERIKKVPLDPIIACQHWRPAQFRVAADDINYRRFFNINELAGVRMESEAVFEEAHRLVFDLLRSGMLQGVRIDHVDGLLNPREYLNRIGDAEYVVVEKILAPHESLRESWPVDGTTGYEFAGQVMGVLIDADGEEPLTRVYQEFTGERADFPTVLLHSKLHIMRNEMAGELQSLARRALAVARQNPKTRDFTQNVFARALEAIVGRFPVYRTYVDREGATDADRRDIEWAVKQARADVMEIDPSVFDFLLPLLTGDLTAAPQSGYSRTDAIECAMRFQQYTGPVMAKGLEDTALYRYPRLMALNEVGCRPDVFGTSVSAFHKTNELRLKHWPNSMLTTSTHDTKFSEDVRARLAVISEMPDEWERQTRAWSRILRAPIGGIEGDAAPDRRDEYLLYQLLAGTWEEPTESYQARMREAMVKVMREAKLRTSWISPNEEYEAAVLAFVDRAFTTAGFLSQFAPWQEKLALWGLENSLVQTVLKLTSPGVPDLYQGSERMLFHLMDPDNRRPVEFGANDCGEKARITRALLLYRRDHPRLFEEGSYEPISVAGELSDCVVAFRRSLDQHEMVVACARFPYRRSQQEWGDTRIEIDQGPWTALFTTGDWFRPDPVTVLYR